MNKILRSIIFTFLVFISTLTKAQDFQTFVHDNYAGATGMFYNPATIADSRYKFDMEFFGISNRLSNNWVQLDNSIIFNWYKWQEANFKNNYLTMIANGQSKDVFLNLEARTLSFMASLNEKNSFGFSFRARAIVNLDNVPEDAAILIFNGNNVDTLLKHHVFEDISQTAVTWGEYGLSYARVLTNTQSPHFFKAGITAKLLQGIGAIYFNEKYLEYDLTGPDTALNVNADIRFGITGNISDLTQFKFEAKPALSLDLGFVYEFRPDHQKYRYDMDGETNLWRKDQNKYKLRVAFSVLDLGSMKFQKQFNSGNFLIDTSLVDLATLHASTLVDLADSINKFYGTENKDSYFSMRLPTTFNLAIDYHVIKGLYVNLAGRLALNQGIKHVEKVHYLSNVTLMPRYEMKWLGISLPIKYDQFKQLNFGIGLRLGPVWLGSTDLLALAGVKQNIHGSDIHLAIKIPILYGAPKDKDGDKVSNKMDKCPSDPGTWEYKGCPDSDGDGIIDKNDDCPKIAGLSAFNGCPDTDSDGIPDKLDECPKIAGLEKFNGCPDTDEDGIIDKLDSCQDIAGLANFNGCPDTDGDGIQDKYDDCPELAGQKEFNGCPDTDSDGLADNKDDCPEVAGPEKFKGCPDTDGDGIRDVEDLCPAVAGLDSLNGCPFIDTDGDGIQDKYDACPKLAGPASNKGCPIADSDNDSVPDKDDLCPMTPGPVSNNGCPFIDKEIQEVLDTAFANLEFETGKSIILTSSYLSLDKVAEVLKDKPNFKLLIEGHTDNVGRDAANMSLSQNRALAVKNYLVSRGIDESRITAKWFGETKPIADNSTAEGRQKNRRVEMNIVFD